MTTKLLIGGQEQTSQGNPMVVLYPWDQVTEAGTCHRLTESGFDALIGKAWQGHESFRTSKPCQRMAILSTLGNRLLKEKESLARLMTLESGKPLKLTRQEVERAAAVCKGYADALNRQEDRWLYVQDRKVQIQRAAYGPVLAITPFSEPLLAVIHKLAPTVAAGTSFTIKPSSHTPLTALFVGALAIECGYPHISVIPCEDDVAEKLVQSGAFSKLSFTGRSHVGWKLQILASRTPISLHLGSASAVIIDDLVFGPKAIAVRCAESAFQFAGQHALSVQRIYVNQLMLDDFMNAFFEASRRIRVGDPMRVTTDMGPMITLDAVHETRRHMREAIEQGANIAFGGSTYNTFTYNPTILNRTHNEMRLMQEEMLAPVVAVQPYEYFEDALRWVNQSRYGLQAGIYTENPHKLALALETLEVGSLLHNDTPSTRLDSLPYGGLKDSGFGREGVMAGLDEMTYVKTLVQRQ